MLERLQGRAKKSNRTDDNTNVFKKRLETYRRDTKPVLDLYEKKNKLIKVTLDPFNLVTKYGLIDKCDSTCRRSLQGN